MNLKFFFPNVVRGECDREDGDSPEPGVYRLPGEVEGGSYYHDLSVLIGEASREVGLDRSDIREAGRNKVNVQFITYYFPDNIKARIHLQMNEAAKAKL